MSIVTQNNNKHSTLSTSTNLGGNTGIIYTSGTTTNISSGSWVYNSPKIEQEKLILYIDLMAQLLGINMNFEKFSEMTPEEIKSFTRDLKLKKLID